MAQDTGLEGLGEEVDGDLAVASTVDEFNTPDDGGGGKKGAQPADDLEVRIEDDETPGAGDADEVTLPARRPEGEGERGGPDHSQYLEDGDEKWSKNVQKRIAREARLKQEARGEAARERERAERAERELAEHRAKSAGAEFDEKIAEAQRKKKEARADGNVDAELDQDSEIARLQAERTIAVRAAPAPKEDGGDGDGKAAPKAAADPDRQKHVDAWMKRNKWFSDPDHEDLRAAALRINKQVADDGYDDRTPGFYRELDRRIGQRLRLPDVKDPPERSPVDPGQGDHQPARKTTVTLSKADLANMRRFGLDPANQDDLKSYARQKMSS